MYRLIVSILAALLVAGCASTQFEHPTKGASAYARDFYECETLAVQRVADRGYAGNQFIINDEIKKCMTIKQGWSIVARE